MKVAFHICLLWLQFFSQYSYGNLNEDPISVDDPFDPCALKKCSLGRNWAKHSEVHPDRKKRADDENSLEDDVKYGAPQHELGDLKTVIFPSSFTPRFGRKRYDLQPNLEMSDDVTADNTMPILDISKKAASINLNSRSAFKPRFAKFKSYNKKILSPRNEFTPRLGRSSAENLVQLSAGSAFTPRLGRSASYKQIRLNTGSAFTPRLGRSENPNQILLNAGGAFTPRLGRSENPNQILLNAGNAFTPRLGRSENPNQIHFSAGSAFTPRLGRSENPNQIQFNAGSAFTPRLGRSENLNQIHLTAGSAFTPRLGRSENQIHLNAGSAFTPRFGRSEQDQQIEEDFLRRADTFSYMNDENAFAPTLRTSENSNMMS